MMKVFLDYLVLEYKKSLKVLLKSIASLLFVILMTCAGVGLAAHMMSQSGVFKKIDVAVVIPENASELKMITQFISTMDSVESICSFNYTTLENAMKELYSGNIQAVISLPETLYNDIYTGQQASATVYFPEETTLNIEIFKELLGDGMSMVSSAEAGVYASTDTAKVYRAAMDQYEIANYISYTYIECAFGRNDIFNKTVFSPFGHVNLYQYYLAAGLMILLLMCGINFSFLYQKQSRMIEKKLGVMGLGILKISLIKVMIMAGILWGIGTCGYGLVLFVLDLTGISMMWFDSQVLLWMVFVALAVAVYFHLVYSIFGSGFHGSVFMLCVNLWMIICSGAVIPLAYLPKVIAGVGAYMPLNFMNQFCADMLFGTVTMNEIRSLCIGIAAVFMMGIGVRKLWNTSLGTRFR